MDELDRTGAVEERHPVAHVVDASDIGLDAHRVAARLGARVADGCPFADRSLPGERPAARQNALEKTGLSTLERADDGDEAGDRKSTRLNSSHVERSYAVFCLKKKRSERDQAGETIALSDHRCEGAPHRRF